MKDGQDWPPRDVDFAWASLVKRRHDHMQDFPESHALCTETFEADFMQRWLR